MSVSDFAVSPVAANDWWRKNEPAGALLNNLMVLFIVAPIAFVFKRFYGLSLIVFSFMIPYGFFVRNLAVSAVRKHLEEHPEAVEEFRSSGIIL